MLIASTYTQRPLAGEPDITEFVPTVAAALELAGLNVPWSQLADVRVDAAAVDGGALIEIADTALTGPMIDVLVSTDGVVVL
jgi:hypothetical protein